MIEANKSENEIGPGLTLVQGRRSALHPPRNPPPSVVTVFVGRRATWLTWRDFNAPGGIWFVHRCGYDRKCRETGAKGAKSVAKTSVAVIIALLWAVAPSAGVQLTAETAAKTRSTDGSGGLVTHRRLSTEDYGYSSRSGGGSMTVTVRSDSSSIVGARLTGLHGQRARIVQKTTTADADFTGKRSFRVT